MPPMPPAGSPAQFLSGLSTMTTAVVRNSAAMDPGVRQRRAGDLGRVDDPILDQVDVLAGGGVESPAGVEPADLLRDDAALEAGVDRDLLERGLQRDLDDVRAGGLVAVQAETLEQAGTGLQQG